jgi:site-specific recombinase XerD
MGHVIGQVTISQLNAVQIQDWLCDRQDAGLQTASLLRVHRRLSTVLQWARDIKSIAINPEIVVEARRRHNLGHNPACDLIPTVAKIKRLQTHFRDEYLGGITMAMLTDFAIFGAMRVGKICKVMFQDVNSEQQAIVTRAIRTYLLRQLLLCECGIAVGVMVVA